MLNGKVSPKSNCKASNKGIFLKGRQWLMSFPAFHLLCDGIWRGKHATALARRFLLWFHKGLVCHQLQFVVLRKKKFHAVYLGLWLGSPPFIHRKDDFLPVGICCFNLSVSTSFSSLTFCECQESSLGTQKEVENFWKPLAKKIIKLPSAKAWPAPAGLEMRKPRLQWELAVLPCFSYNFGSPINVIRREQTLAFFTEMFVGLLLACDFG